MPRIPKSFPRAIPPSTVESHLQDMGVQSDEFMTNPPPMPVRRLGSAISLKTWNVDPMKIYEKLYPKDSDVERLVKLLRQ